MIETKVAKRYARSLIGLSSDTGLLDAVAQDMKFLISVLDENRQLGVLMRNPIIHTDKKRAVLKQIFSGKVQDVSMKFMDIVTAKSREMYLEHIAKEFIEEYKILKGIRTAEIISAVGLDDTLRQQVYRIIRGDSDAGIELIEKTDRRLIGGFVLRMGDKQYDASIAAELRKLAREFSKKQTVVRN
ncbi:MAG: ATP synthase F1 subunit delta [Bacteroidia bacterium]|nr:ATP synthase F1 subunit delta [Bacteroidia bacterium]